MRLLKPLKISRNFILSHNVEYHSNLILKIPVVNLDNLTKKLTKCLVISDIFDIFVACKKGNKTITTTSGSQRLGVIPGIII